MPLQPEVWSKSTRQERCCWIGGQSQELIQGWMRRSVQPSRTLNNMPWSGQPPSVHPAGCTAKRNGKAQRVHKAKGGKHHPPVLQEQNLLLLLCSRSHRCLTVGLSVSQPNMWNMKTSHLATLRRCWEEQMQPIALQSIVPVTQSWPRRALLQHLSTHPSLPSSLPPSSQTHFISPSLLLSTPSQLPQGACPAAPLR